MDDVDNQSVTGSEGLHMRTSSILRKGKKEKRDKTVTTQDDKQPSSGNSRGSKCWKSSEDGIYLCGGQKGGLFCTVARLALLLVFVVGFIVFAVFGILANQEHKECVYPSTCAGDYACLPTGYCNCTELNFRDMDLLVPHRPFACDLTRPFPPTVYGFLMWYTIAATIGFAVFVVSISQRPELAIPVIEKFEELNKHLKRQDHRIDSIREDHKGEYDRLKKELTEELAKLVAKKGVV
jgi:hypothetical protein